MKFYQVKSYILGSVLALIFASFSMGALAAPLTAFKIEVRNHTAYTANPSMYPAKVYFQPVQQSLAASATTYFRYVLKRPTAGAGPSYNGPYIQYTVQHGGQTRSCQFQFTWYQNQTGNAQCSANAVPHTNGIPIDCYVCKLAYDKESNTCDLTFSLNPCDE